MESFALSKEFLLLVPLILSFSSPSVQQVLNERKEFVGCFIDDFDRTMNDLECMVGAVPPIPHCPQCSSSTEAGKGPGCKNPEMTVERCFEICRTNPTFVFAGLQGGDECFCGTIDSTYNRIGEVPIENCQMNCMGDNNPECGDIYVNSVFDLRKSSPCTITIEDDFIIPSEAVKSGDEPVAFPLGHMLTFQCQTGYAISSTNAITCGSDGLFQPAVPTCNPVGPDTENGVECPSLTPPTDGTISPQQATFREGQIATFACKSGLSLYGNATLTCLSTRQWDSSAPTCGVPNCGNPPEENFQGLTGDGQNAQYRCDEGLQSWSLRCDANELQWTGERLTCTDNGNTDSGTDNGNQGGGNEPESPRPDNLPVEDGNTAGLLRGLSSLLWIIAIIVVVGITIMLIGCIISHSVSQDTASRNRPKDNTMLVVPAAESQPPTDNNHFGVTDDDRVERNAV